jgi:hypothetical protein
MRKGVRQFFAVREGWKTLARGCLYPFKLSVERHPLASVFRDLSPEKLTFCTVDKKRGEDDTTE